MIAAPGISAQDPTTLAGRITASTGEPLLAASILIPAMNVGVASNADGRYVLIIPASRATGQTVNMSVNMIGRATETVEVTLRPGAPLVGAQVRSLGGHPGGLLLLGLRRHGPDGTVYVDRPGPDAGFEQEDVIVLYGSRGEFEEMAAASPLTDDD